MLERVVVIADEEAVPVEVIGMGEGAVDGVGDVVGNDGVAGEIPRHDGSVFNPGTGEGLDEGRPGERGVGVDDEGEPEPGAGTRLALDAKIGVMGHDLPEDAGIGAAGTDDGGEFAELLATDGPGDLKGAEVVAREDEAEGFGEGIGGFGAGDMVVVREITGPAMGAEGKHDVMEFRVVCHHEAALHGGDVVREEA